MGAPRGLKSSRTRDRNATGKSLPALPSGALRRKPRSWVEWKTLRSWGKLPPWDETPAGYLLREAREAADLTQAELANRLGCSQQAVAQAERWESNPTISFVKRWALATDRVAVVSLPDLPRRDDRGKDDRARTVRARNSRPPTGEAPSTRKRSRRNPAP